MLPSTSQATVPAEGPATAIPTPLTLLCFQPIEAKAERHQLLASAHVQLPRERDHAGVGVSVYRVLPDFLGHVTLSPAAVRYPADYAAEGPLAGGRRSDADLVASRVMSH